MEIGLQSQGMKAIGF